MLETLATETFVSHLECGLRGDRYEADQIHGLSAAGRPLLVRYDLDRLRHAVTKEMIASRTPEGAIVNFCPFAKWRTSFGSEKR